MRTSECEAKKWLRVLLVVCSVRAARRAFNVSVFTKPCPERPPRALPDASRLDHFTHLDRWCFSKTPTHNQFCRSFSPFNLHYWVYRLCLSLIASFFFLCGQRTPFDLKQLYYSHVATTECHFPVRRDTRRQRPRSPPQTCFRLILKGQRLQVHSIGCRCTAPGGSLHDHFGVVFYFQQVVLETFQSTIFFAQIAHLAQLRAHSPPM